MADELFEKYRKKLDKLNLKTIDDLENLVKPLIKEATLIITKKSSKIPKDTALTSHFGGQPYFEKGEKWPTSQDGNSLEFVFQIFNECNINLPDNIKLIQFYYDFEKCPWGTSDEGWLIKIYANIDKDNIVTIEKPKELSQVKYCEIKYETIRSLPDWDGIESYDENASMLSCVLDEDEPWKNYQNVVKKLIGEQDNKSQLGGYACWIQGEDKPEDKDFHLLFQIDSSDDAEFMWGDSGQIYVFYNPQNKKIEFTLQCY